MQEWIVLVLVLLLVGGWSWLAAQQQMRVLRREALRCARRDPAWLRLQWTLTPRSQRNLVA